MIVDEIAAEIRRRQDERRKAFERQVATRREYLGWVQQVQLLDATLASLHQALLSAVEDPESAEKPVASRDDLCARCEHARFEHANDRPLCGRFEADLEQWCDCPSFVERV